MTQPDPAPPHTPPEKPAEKPAGQPSAISDTPELSGAPFTEKERKALFLNVVVGIVLLEFAVTVGAVVYSIANADKSAAGMLRFNFPWVGYLVTVVLVPVLVMLILHLVSLGFSRTLLQDAQGGQGGDPATQVSGRAATFFAMVRGAPTVILFAGFVLMGAAVYYLDGVMALLLKLGDSFQTVAIWIIGALGVAFCVNACARAVLAYKTRKLEAEYAFRREVFERTGTVLMSAKQVALPTQPGIAPSANGAYHTGNSGLKVLPANVDTITNPVTNPVTDTIIDVDTPDK